MLKRTASITLLSFALLLCALPLAWPSSASDQKPSGALREVMAQQKKMREAFDREVKAGRARPEDLDKRLESLVRLAAERAARFKPGDWKGEELYALATLYQWAEQFAPAAESYRAYLQQGAQGWRAANARVSLLRALVETERIKEAAKELAELGRGILENEEMLVTQIALHKDLALAFRDLGQYEDAAVQAEAGYKLAALSQAASRFMEPLLRESRDRDQAILAALVVVVRERLGKKKEAESFDQGVRKDLADDPRLQLMYEAELASERMIGQTAPELKIARWLDSQPTSLSEQRGRVVLLDFWAMWCSPCLVAFPHLRELQEKYSSRSLTIIGVTRFYGRSDKEAGLSLEQEWRSLQDFKRRYELRYPVAVGAQDDLTNDDRFGVISLPTIVVLDRRGAVRLVKRGTGDYRQLDRLIAKLIAENK
jgi:thiol-disulfide isomerase/thioredoxin